jgi:hypothetical protein
VKYLEKKKRRIWRKKVNYDCRKKVADGRLRIKGKLVTFDQAREQNISSTSRQKSNSRLLSHRRLFLDHTHHPYASPRNDSRCALAKVSRNSKGTIH